MGAMSAAIVGRTLALPYYARVDLARTNTTVNPPLPAGLVSLHTCAEGFLEIPQEITFTWVTSATVANRSLGIVFHDVDGNTTGQILCDGTQPASTSYRYTFILDAGGSFVSGVFGMAPLPFRYLQAGDSWQIFGVNLDSGDVQNGMTHIEQRVPTGPALEPAGGAPVAPALIA